MKEQRVGNFAELHEALGRLRRDAGWVWRGQGDAGWSLLPRAGRAVLAGQASAGQDEVFLRRWKVEAAPYLEQPPADEWDWLGLAHLTGFATRLLSWTVRPLQAAWFAAADAGRGDAVIYSLKAGSTLLDVGRESSPWTVKTPLVAYTPRTLPAGMSRQIAVVTLHTPPTRAVDPERDGSDRLERIVIDAAYRRELLFELNQYGVNRETLFPGLDGLSRHFNWVQRNFAYWAEGLRSTGDC